MTHPGDGEFSPPGGLGPGGLGLGFTELQTKTEEDWREETNSEVLGHFGPVGGFADVVRSIVNGVVQALGGDFGPLIDAIAALLPDPPDWLDIAGWVAGIFATVTDVADKIRDVLVAIGELIPDWVPLVGNLEDVVAGFGSNLNETNTTAATAGSVAAGAAATANSKSKVTKGTTAPSSPATGDLWIDTTSGDGYALYKTWNGSAWVVTTDKVAADIYDQLQTGDIIDSFTTNGTWSKRAGLKRILLYEHGGGAGGGRGRDPYGNVNSRGAGGGPGGWQRAAMFDAADLTSTVAVTIGAGGVGGDSDDEAGQTGGTTSFGSYLSATGGTGLARAMDAGLTGQRGAGVDSALLLNFGGAGGRNGIASVAGGNGPYSTGGSAGSSGGGDGGNGNDPSSSLLFGPGGGGGGGGVAGAVGDGGDGGDGGLGAGGGGGGAYGSFGFNGDGGQGGNGRLWVVNQFV